MVTEMDFTEELLTWYAANQRDFPWKRTSDPYLIWVSEIVLQQTRISSGLVYYMQIVEHFPTVQAMAAAPIDKVLRLWQGLGYYSRAKNMHATAKRIVDEYGGVFPSHYAQLKELKGIGNYTAAALASFAFGEPVVALDGNGYRILARFFGFSVPIDTGAGRKTFAELAENVFARERPAEFNYALMDFGSLVCKPEPLCHNCPLADACHAHSKRQTKILPVKSKRPKMRIRNFYYLFVRYGPYTYLRKRTEKSIWQGLYEFPNIVTEEFVEPQQLLDEGVWPSQIRCAPLRPIYLLEYTKNQLTNVVVHTAFYYTTVVKPSNRLKRDFIRVPVSRLDEYPFPRPLLAFLKKNPKVLMTIDIDE
jgi:A/G-specific adenine glycosylase